MENRLSYQQALTKASALCSKTDKCRADMITYFEKWGLSPEEIQEAMTFLIKERFVDDQRYAEHFAHDKFSLNKWGQYKIIYMLRQKKIPEDYIKSALEKISEDETEVNLRMLMKARNKSIKGETAWERKSKLIHYALRKGFDSELVFRIAGEIYSKME